MALSWRTAALFYSPLRLFLLSRLSGWVSPCYDVGGFVSLFTRGFQMLPAAEKAK